MSMQHTLRTRQSEKAGLAPGTPVFLGERKRDAVRVDVIAYTEHDMEERQGVSLDESEEIRARSRVTWVNVTGIHDVSLVEAIGERFGLHPLTLEDIVSTAQRPKADEYDGYFFIVAKMLTYNDEARGIDIEQASLIFGDGFVLSFIEDEGDVFDEVRARIRSGKGRIRKMNADFLAYSLLDAVVDNYFLVLEKLGESIEDMEDEIVDSPSRQTVGDLHRLKRGMLFLRKSVWPLREEVKALEKSDSSLIEKATRVFLRDLYDHTIQVIDTVETYRDVLAGMHDTYLSSVSNRMNEIMKVLTIISTLFIPLTFLAGVYGMNFEFMPELRWRWGYLLVWCVMAVTAGGMLVYFRRKKWL